MKPSFLIVGAAKSGTTTLRDYLADRPDVFIARGEPHYFDIDANYRRGPAWYRGHFAEARNGAIVGEKTASYSYIPAAAERIHLALPDAKLIWLFRDPVARAYSHYWHSVTHGNERLEFEMAVLLEETRNKKDIYRGFLRRSVYAEQVRRFVDYFPRQQMLFLAFEELVREPARVLGEVLRFIGADATVGTVHTPRRSNVTTIPRHFNLEFVAKQIFGDSRAYKLIHRLNQRETEGYPKMRPITRQFLTAYFTEPNKELEQLTGRDFAVWS